MLLASKMGTDRGSLNKLALLREQLPCLAISEKKLEEEKVKLKKSETAVDNMMEFLEIMVLS